MDDDDLDDLNVEALADAYNVAARTIRRDLTTLGLKYVEFLPAPEIEADCAGKRLRFAQRELPTAKRQDRAFSDECILRARDTRKAAWRKATKSKDARKAPTVLRPRRLTRRWAATCHVWGYLSRQGLRLQLFPAKGNGPKGGINGDDYLECLKGSPLAQEIGGKNVQFVQDNCETLRKHHWRFLACSYSSGHLMVARGQL